MTALALVSIVGLFAQQLLPKANANTSKSPPTGASFQGFQLGATVEKEVVTGGERISLNLTLRNISDKAQNIYYDGDYRYLDISATNAKNEPVPLTKFGKAQKVF